MLFLTFRRLVSFLTVLSLVLLGFSHAFYLLYRDALPSEDPSQQVITDDFASWLAIMKVYLIIKES
jgi:hypothetical protein